MIASTALSGSSRRPFTSSRSRANSGSPATARSRCALARALAVPVVVVLFAWDFQDHAYWATAVFAAAMATDQVDGWLARRRNQTSAFGSLLDPIADKVLVLATLAMLVGEGTAPAWMVAAIVAREIAVSGLRLAALERGVVMGARDLGKLKTWSQAVAATLGALPPAWAEVDVLVNNAGLGRGLEKAQEGDPAEWDEMVDTNVKGLLYVTRAVVPGMAARGRGHVVNIGSVAGHEVYPGGAVYCATKHAVGAFSESLRQEVTGRHVRVSLVEPGAVATELASHNRDEILPVLRERFADNERLEAEDIAETISFIVTRPRHVAVNELLVRPTEQEG